MLNLVLALLAGVVTIAAPCTLPMLPILLGASVGQTSKARPAMIAAGFVLSFSVVALALGAITRVFDFDPNMLRNAAAVLLLGFGLLMIWPAPFEWLSSRIGWIYRRQRGLLARPDRRLRARHDARPGLDALRRPGAGLDPDRGRDLERHRLGQPAAGRLRHRRGLPMLAIAYGGQAVTTRVRSVARIAPKLQQGFGVVVIAFAVAAYFQYDTLIVAWLTGFYPNGQIGL